MQIKKLLILTIALLLTPSVVNAASINITCPEKVKENTDFTCTINGTYTENVNHIIVKYRYSDKISYQNIELKDNWTFLLNENPSATKFGIENATEKTGNINIAELTFKATTGSAGKDLYIEFYDFDGSNSSAQVINYTEDPIRKNIHIKSNNNNLKTLTIDNENITLTNETNYTYTTDKDPVIINATLQDDNAACENLTREVTLNEDTKTVTYAVTAEDGSTKEYKITITKNQSNTNIQEDTNSNTNANLINNGVTKTTSIKTGDKIKSKFVLLITSILSILIILKINKNKKRSISEF